MKTTVEKITISQLKMEIEAMRFEHSMMVRRIESLVDKALEIDHCFPDGFLDVLSMTICDPPARLRRDQ